MTLSRYKTANSNLKTSNNYADNWDDDDTQYTGYNNSAIGTKNSSFWLGKDFYSSNIQGTNRNGFNTVQLAMYQRSIANFVKILTQKNITVSYDHTNKSGSTDGTKIFLSGDIKPETFDVHVGLSLHEASHILLTDFTSMKHIEVITNSIANWGTYEYMPEAPRLYCTENIFIKIGDLYKIHSNILTASRMERQMHTLINVIEDRRIDRYIKDNAPGYVGYYEQLYDHYFHNEKINNAIATSEFNAETYDDYIFYIINMTNKSINPDALKSLRKCLQLIDLPNINRLRSTADSAIVAWNVYITILEAMLAASETSENKNPENDDNNDKVTPDKESGSNEGESDDNNDKVTPDKESGSNEGESSDNRSLHIRDGNSVSKASTELHNAIQAQLDMVDGNIKKQSIDSRTVNEINIIADSDINTANIDVSRSIKNVPVTIVNGVNAQLLSSDMLRGNYRPDAPYSEAVLAGQQLGRALGRKLKLRNESREIKSTRLTSGRIDKRLIAELGTGNANIFSNTACNITNPGLIHLSIDASGSMDGAKWVNTIKTVTAIAVACNSISNMDCEISLRLSAGPNGICIWNIYRSSLQSLNSILHYLKCIDPNGCTPEGLAMHPTIDRIIRETNRKDVYFINFSDGQPDATYRDSAGRNRNYSSKIAERHTASLMKRLRQNNIQIASYFISAGYWGDSDAKKCFANMYGKDAVYVSVTELNGLAKTINAMLERKA